MSFRLYAFGGLRLEAEGKVVTGPPAQRRRLALLALLAASPQRKLTREKAFGYLWPEQSTARARHLLSESLYVVRRRIGEGAILSAQDELVLNPDVIWSDVVSFREGFANGGGEEVTGLYRGPFLDGFFLKDAPEFDVWAGAMRDRFAREYARALESLAEKAAARGDTVAATDFWHRLSEHQPFSSRIAGRYMEALAAAGERARALQFASAHAARLLVELGVEPDSEFQAILARLQQPIAPPPALPGSGGSRPITPANVAGESADRDGTRDAPTSPRPDAPTPTAPTVADGNATTREAPHAVATGTSDAANERAVARKPIPRRAVVGLAGLAIVMVAVLFAGNRRHEEPLPVLGSVRGVTFEWGVEIEPDLSPDGRFVAYAGGSPSRIYLRQQGSRPVRLVTPDSGPDQYRPHWSPDGARIAFDAGHHVFVIPALGGVPRQVIADGWSPTWSPDGRRIAYALGDTIFTADAQGGGAARLAVVIQPAELAWSPDGRWIALSSGNDTWDGFIHVGNLAQSRIVLVAADDGRVVDVTDRNSMNVAPTWSPDSHQLLFISNREGARDIFAVHIATDGRSIGKAGRLSTGLDAHSMALSSNGDRLVYAAYHGHVNIWSLRISDGAPVGLDSAVELTTGNQIIESISVSPDHEWLYFTSDRAGNSDIWRIPLAGGDPVQITSHSTDDFAPEQSPDGQWLAFYSQRSGSRDIWLRPTGPGDAARLTDDSAEEHAPHWSPDGMKLCYSHNTGAGGSVEVLRREGTGWSRPIVPRDEHGAPNRLLGCSGWLPDGHRMVVQDPGRTMIALMSEDGGPLQVIYRSDPGHGRPLPIWVRVEPRSGTIYFRDWVSIWAIEPGNTEPRQIVRFDDPSRRSTRIEMDTDGRRIYFSLGDPQSDLFTADLSRPGSRRD